MPWTLHEAELPSVPSINEEDFLSFKALAKKNRRKGSLSKAKQDSTEMVYQEQMFNLRVCLRSSRRESSEKHDEKYVPSGRHRSPKNSH